MQYQVIVSLRVEGFHLWSDAPAEVAFLRDLHRHIFHIRCWKDVEHGDRDVEIIQLKRAIGTFLYVNFGRPCVFKTMSCEHIAALLCTNFLLAACEVLEDGENGGMAICPE